MFQFPSQPPSGVGLPRAPLPSAAAFSPLVHILALARRLMPEGRHGRALLSADRFSIIASGLLLCKRFGCGMVRALLRLLIAPNAFDPVRSDHWTGRRVRCVGHRRRSHLSATSVSSSPAFLPPAGVSDRQLTVLSILFGLR